MCARLRGRSGLDHGPISARRRGWPPWALRRPRRRGWPGSSVRRGWGGAEPSKRPRAAWRRFDPPRPQRLLAARRHRVRPGRRAQGGDLAGSRTTTGAWRWPGWSPRAMAGQAAIDVFDKGVAARGVPPAPARPTTAQPRAPAGAQSPPRPAGARALPGRRTYHRQTLQAHHPRATTSASARPCSATWTSSHWPTESPSPRGDGSTASTTPCNTQRPHQGLPGRITGQQAQDATEVARAPRPGHDTDPITPADRTRARRARRAPTAAPAQAHRPQRRARSRPSPATGADHIGGIAFLVRRALAGHRTTAIWDATTITFAHAHGRHPDPVQLAARRRHLRLPPPARPHQPTRQAPGRNRPQPSPKS